ncbi:MAG: hypothetical protein Q8O37_06935 [Sulfuricellaceae bacterium]|nr:hypothetical protein [Sulfuricellaceae bacterium]
MQIRSLLLSLLAAGVVGVGVLPKPVSALMLGELKLHSWLGEPLRATIPLHAGADEQVDGTCFYLGRPGQQDDYESYLTQGKLILEESAAGLTLRLTTSKPVNSPFLNIIIEARCGQGAQRREFVLLLDPLEQRSSSIPPRPVSIDATPVASVREGEGYIVRASEAINDIVERLYPNDVQKQRRMAREIKKANPEFRDYSRKQLLPEGHSIRIPDLKVLPQVPDEPVSVAPSALPPIKSAPPAKLVGKSESQTRSAPVTFRLQLSSGILDMSAVGSMSEEQRQFLREKQLLLESDDQVAAMMSIKNRILQLESTIEEMKLALEAGRTAAERQPEPVPDRREAAPVVEPASESLFQVNIRDMDWRQLADNDSIRSMAGALLILLLLLSSWWRWRQSRAEARLNTLFGHQFVAKPGVSEPVAQFESPANDVRPQPEVLEAPVDILENLGGVGEDMHYPTTIFGATDDIVTVTETESVLDEADLYLAYGWGKRAIDLLSSHLENHPEDVPLLKKMFEAYHALGMKNEFEQLAVKIQYIDDNGLRVLVQKLGRVLDAENPLYQSSLDAENAFEEDMNPHTIPMFEDEEAENIVPPESETSETLGFEFAPESATQPGSGSQIKADPQAEPESHSADHLMEWPENQQKTAEEQKPQ